MAEHNELGKEGEKIAAKYLKEKNFEILEKNYRFKHLELDIVTKKDEQLIVVEVKTRASEYMAGPHETVSKKKQKDIIKATNEYIYEHDIDLEVRFDIISIILNNQDRKIEHIEDAFYPTL